MSKFKIEKVNNYVSKIDSCIVSSYMKIQDRIINVGFINKAIARERTGFETGIWHIKLKPIKNN